MEIILKEAFQVKNELETVQSRLKSMFGNFIPDIVMRKLAENLTSEDLPLSATDEPPHLIKKRTRETYSSEVFP